MLDVGAVIYLLDKKTQNVVPCRVVEKVSSISLDGENVHHVIETPAGKKLKLEDYKSPWFSSLEETRDFLMKSAATLVEASIQRAEAVREKTFPSPNVIDTTHISETKELAEELSDESLVVSPEMSGEDVYVDLGNGQKAKVNFPKDIK